MSANDSTVKGNVEIVRNGDKVVIPKDMTIKELKVWAERELVKEEQEVAINEAMDCHPLEGAYALARAMKEKFGWTALVPTPTWFGKRPPNTFSFQVDYNKTVEVSWGRMEIPGVEGYIQPSVDKKDGRFIFTLGGVIKQKNRGVVQELADLTRKMIREESIYRGKAIYVTFPDPSEDFNIQDNQPTFMDLSGAKNELIFDDVTMRLIQTSLFTPVERTDHCRKFKIPLKRGILLEGKYGTGKTLTANVAAGKCVANGWTFIYLKKVSQLQEAIVFARKYQPAMIFAEDIDQILGTQERTQDVNNVLNTIDGIDSKNNEIITVLTTNHVENLNSAILRPGRLDTIVSIQAPDAQAVSKLIHLYGRGLLIEDIDLTRVSKKLEGRIPAFIREVVEKAKLAAVQDLPDGEDQIVIREVELTLASEAMLTHAKLAEPKPQDTRTSVEKVAQIIGQQMVIGVQKVMQSASLKAAVEVSAIETSKG